MGVSRFAPILFVFFLTTSTWASSNAATVVNKSNVLVDGLPIVGSTIFGGNIIRYNGSTSTQLRTDGTLIQLLPQSELAYSRSDVELISGQINFWTENRMPVLVERFVVSPMSNDLARYSVQRKANDVVVVVAQDSPLMISSGKVNITLLPGNAAQITNASNPNSPIKIAQQKSSPVGERSTTAKLD